MNSVFSRRLAAGIVSTRSLSTTACTRMSHIGSLPVKYSSDVQIKHINEPYSTTDSRFFDKTTLEITGPLGTRKMAIEPFVKLDINQVGEESTVVVNVADSQVKRQRQMWGTTRALINNCVIGVTEGFNATLRFVGVGYRAALEDGKLALRLGYSHPINMDIPEGLKVSVPVPTRVLISGLDLQQVKQFAAKVREWKKPEPYNQKGIFINDETIRKKDGKKK